MHTRVETGTYSHILAHMLLAKPIGIDGTYFGMNGTYLGISGDYLH